VVLSPNRALELLILDGKRGPERSILNEKPERPEGLFRVLIKNERKGVPFLIKRRGG